jgi:hypothetical protein
VNNKKGNIIRKVKLRHVHKTFVAVAKKLVLQAYSECVFLALVIQRAKRMRRATLSSLAGLALHNFSTLSHKRYDLKKMY